MRSEVVRRTYAIGFESGSIASTDAPHLINRVKRSSLQSAVIGVDDAAMVISGVFLCEVGSHLCQRLRRRNAYSERHAHRLQHAPVQLFAPLLQLFYGETVENGERLVD